MGSTSADFPFPGVITYSATKSFTAYLAEGLHYELEGKVDVLSYRPGHVDTKMNPKEKSGDNEEDYITPERAAFVCLRDLGCMPMTYGDVKHERAAQAMRFVPSHYLRKAAYASLCEEYDAQQKE